MKFVLRRRWKEQSSLCGKFEVYNSQDDLIFSCYSLENKEIGATKNADLSIPYGFYNLEWFESPRFNNTLKEITGDMDVKCICVWNDEVPALRRILIHWGNTDKDTEGCILLGKTFTPGSNQIGASRQVFKELYQLLKNVDITKVSLEVVDELNL